MGNKSRNRLTARQRLYAERCLLYHDYPYHVDAYESVYGKRKNRRHAVVNAARIYAMPAVQNYLDEIRAISAQKAEEKEEKRHEEFLKTLGIYR